MFPFLSASIFSLLLSTQMTLFPKSARHAPETEPTYPVPITAMFAIFLPCLSFCRSASRLQNCHRLSRAGNLLSAHTKPQLADLYWNLPSRKGACTDFVFSSLVDVTCPRRNSCCALSEVEGPHLNLRRQLFFIFHFLNYSQDIIAVYRSIRFILSGF